VIAVIGIFLVVLWLFTQYGSGRDVLAIVGNILLFAGMAIGFIGFMKISKLARANQQTGQGTNQTQAQPDNYTVTATLRGYGYSAIGNYTFRILNPLRG
jgi:hypothetical protein